MLHAPSSTRPTWSSSSWGGQRDDGLAGCQGLSASEASPTWRLSLALRSLASLRCSTQWCPQNAMVPPKCTQFLAGLHCMCCCPQHLNHRLPHPSSLQTSNTTAFVPCTAMPTNRLIYTRSAAVLPKLAACVKRHVTLTNAWHTTVYSSLLLLCETN